MDVVFCTPPFPAVSGGRLTVFLRGQTSDKSRFLGEGAALDDPIISVLVVEDYEPFRDFIVATFQTQPQLRILEEVSDGAEAVRKAQQLQPDLILLDVGLPTLNGIEAARQIQAVCPKSKILFVSENRSPDIAEEALRIGGLGYVLKSDAAKELLVGINAVLRGKRFVSASLGLQVLATSDIPEGRDPTDGNRYVQFGSNELLPEFLASMIEATAADFGSVQLFDSRNRVLRIVAHRGFESEFLRYFDTVNEKERCACGKAMSERSRVVVADVTRDPIFSSDIRGLLLRAKVRSVQSTPLINAAGNLVGMVSTHYDRPGGPKPYMWSRVDDLAARFLAMIGELEKSAEKP